VNLIKNCRAAKLKLGKDVGIISYNDTPLKEILSDGISVISTDHARMGETAARLILDNKKEKIKNIYPLFATSDDPLKDDIRKFENLGTRPFFIEQAIGKALEFHEMIGSERKEKRLCYLKNYWMERVKDLPKVKINTSLDPKWGCAIGNVAIEGKKPADLEAFLFDKYKIHTVSIEWENIHGVRITPNVYTTTGNLDLLVEGITSFAKT